MRVASQLFAAVILPCLLPLTAAAYSSGVQGYSGKPPGAGCGGCHPPAEADPAATLAITGPAVLAPGATGAYEARLGGGLGVRGGLDLAAGDPAVTLVPDGLTTQLLGKDITHRPGALAFGAGAAVFRFSLVAPATPGKVTLYAAGNSVDGKGSPAGDRPVLATLEVSIAAAQNAAPTLAGAPAASPASVTDKTTALSVLGADDGGEAALTYSWEATVAPAPVTFSVNASHDAASTTATFSKVGAYTFTVTATDREGLKAQGTVEVAVTPTLKDVRVYPPAVGLPFRATQVFAAGGTDQFGNALRAPPTFSWTVSGGGSISPTGTFTAGAISGGPFAVTAAANGKTWGASVMVADGVPPVIARRAESDAAAGETTAKTVNLSVVATDDGGEGSLVYNWSVYKGPGPVTFSQNDSNAAKGTTATFAHAGTYTLLATVKDGLQLTALSPVLVTVKPVLSGLAITPPSAVVAPNQTQKFTRIAKDQFDEALVVQPSTTWTVTGGGTVDAKGLFTAGATLGGPHTVTSSLNGFSATAEVTIDEVLDKRAPSSEILSPSEGGVVSGLTPVQVKVSDDVGVAEVEFFIDGVSVGKSLAKPWDFSLDTAALSDGPHKLGAWAKDAAGNVGKATPVNLTFQNGVSGDDDVLVPDPAPTTGSKVGCASTGLPAQLPLALLALALLRITRRRRA